MSFDDKEKIIDKLKLEENNIKTLERNIDNTEDIAIFTNVITNTEFSAQSFVNTKNTIPEPVEVNSYKDKEELLKLLDKGIQEQIDGGTSRKSITVISEKQKMNLSLGMIMWILFQIMR